jgi:uncharacterized membrane protein
MKGSFLDIAHSGGKGGTTVYQGQPAPAPTSELAGQLLGKYAAMNARLEILEESDAQNQCLDVAVAEMRNRMDVLEAQDMFTSRIEKALLMKPSVNITVDPKVSVLPRQEVLKDIPIMWWGLVFLMTISSVVQMVLTFRR